MMSSSERASCPVCFCWLRHTRTWKDHRSSSCWLRSASCFDSPLGVWVLSGGLQRICETVKVLTSFRALFSR